MLDLRRTICTFEWMQLHMHKAERGKLTNPKLNGKQTTTAKNWAFSLHEQFKVYYIVHICLWCFICMFSGFKRFFLVFTANLWTTACFQVKKSFQICELRMNFIRFFSSFIFRLSELFSFFFLNHYGVVCVRY